MNHPCGSDVITLRPGDDELRDLGRYVQNLLENDDYLRAGLIKVIPKTKIESKSMLPTHIVPKPQAQTLQRIDTLSDTASIFEISFQPQQKTTFGDFTQTATELGRGKPMDEKSIWADLMENPQQGIYGIDSRESLFQDGDKWNMNKWTFQHSIINTFDKNNKLKRLRGIHNTYVNIGMASTWFPVHCEDSNLGSINFLHFGAPKKWYAVSYENARKLEKLLKNTIGDQFACKEAWTKCCVVTPDFLEKNRIPFVTATQEPGQFIFTLYQCYHWGVNTGINVCESSNLASPKFCIFFHHHEILCPQTCSYGNGLRKTKRILGKWLDRVDKYKQSFSADTTSNIESKSSKKTIGGEKKFRCEICHINFKNKYNLKGHDQKFHKSVVKRFNCPDCLFDSISAYNILAHHTVKHPNLTTPGSIKDIASTMKSNRIHKHDHTINMIKEEAIEQPRTYKGKLAKRCHQCGRTCAGTSSLKRHIRRKHVQLTRKVPPTKTVPSTKTVPV